MLHGHLFRFNRTYEKAAGVSVSFHFIMKTISTDITCSRDSKQRKRSQDRHGAIRGCSLEFQPGLHLQFKARALFRIPPRASAWRSRRYPAILLVFAVKQPSPRLHPPACNHNTFNMHNIMLLSAVRRPLVCWSYIRRLPILLPSRRAFACGQTLLVRYLHGTEQSTSFNWKKQNK